ncbi:MAG: hypothetical protein A2X94_09845 [Bdellovibrionales bacterium GWB1_55_8]|nr:MAG: hypothetical protein A2X94_09845 [Bdellovibrionales bacterium GWB1_55_8]
MKLVSAPAGLRLALATLFLCVPMAAVEVVIAVSAPWWRLPWVSMAAAAVAAFCAWLVVLGLAMRTHRWTVPVVSGFTVIWFASTALYAFSTRNSGLSFFSALILMFAAASAFWIRRELDRSFLDPELRWYQGLPRPIGGLSCVLFAGDKQHPCRVSRLDSEGAFIYSDLKGDAGITEFLGEPKKVQLRFGFRGCDFQCSGFPIALLAQGFGAGFQFRDLSPDHRKDLGDFIELLRGEGYVQ